MAGKYAYISGESDFDFESEKTRLFTGISFFAAAYLLKLFSTDFVSNIFFISGFLFCCYPLAKKVLKMIFDVLSKKAEPKILTDEKVLILVTAVSAVGINYYSEALTILILHIIGEIIEHMSLRESKRYIEEMLELKPQFARIIIDNNEQKISPEQVKIGSTIIVRSGETIPLDGKIVEGSSSVDTSVITGESVPKMVFPGKKVMAGMINVNGLLKIIVEKPYTETSISKLTKLIDSMSLRKSKKERLLDRFSKYYTPLIILAAIVYGFVIPLVTGNPFQEWTLKALMLLVISCPVVFVVSIPLAILTCIGRASKSGILIKGGEAIEKLHGVKTVIFDKTGTLTVGNFKIKEIVPVEGFKKEELLKIAALAEINSNHPIAEAINSEYQDGITEAVLNFKEVHGKGVNVQTSKGDILAGNSKLLLDEGIIFEEIDTPETVVYIALNGKYRGHILIADELQNNVNEILEEIKSLGIKRFIMLTGDNREISKKIYEEVKFDEFYTDLLPEEKLEIVKKIQSHYPDEKVAFIGDGINDAPSMMQADVGVAINKRSNDLTVETSDIVLLNDDFNSIMELFEITKTNHSVVRVNIFMPLIIKIILIATLFSSITMMSLSFIILIDFIVEVLAILNSLISNRKFSSNEKGL
jgi:Cd2+/Zn2+-exporting ATPase